MPTWRKFPRRHDCEPGPAAQGLRRRLGEADAFVVVTPECHRGDDAAVKQPIDPAKAEWLAKTARFVSDGGVSGRLRGVEQLRPVSPSCTP